MRKWVKTVSDNGTSLSSNISADEALVVQALCTNLVRLFDERENSAPVDELSRITGIKPGPSDPPEDKALQRIFPDFIHPEDQLSGEKLENLNTGLRSLHEPNILGVKREAIATIADTTPAGGGDIILTEEQGIAWMQGLNDMRLFVGTHLDVDQEGHYLEHITEDSAQFVAIYDWLSHVLDLLVATLMLAS